MKLSRVLSGIIIVSCISAIAVSAAEVSLVLKGGLNLTKWRGAESTSYKNVLPGTSEDKTFKPGLVAGLGLRIAFIDYLALQPEFIYSMKGFRRTSDLSGEETVLFLKVNYTEMPILLKITIPAGPVTPNFYAGPALGIRVKFEGYTKTGNEKVQFDKYQKEAYNNHMRLLDLSIAMGAGIDFKVGSGSIILDLRYTMGLRSIWLGTKNNAYIPTEKNSTFSFILGYAIHFNK